jgi:hypothetical protein
VSKGWTENQESRDVSGWVHPELQK